MSARKTSKASRKRRNRKRTGTRGGARRLLWFAAVVGLAVLVAYTAYLDARVRSHFEGQRWALPARVYARPLELFRGQAISVEQLRHELRLLRYSQGGQTPGHFRRAANRFTIYTRGFAFADGRQAPQTVHLEVRGGRLHQLRVEGSSASLVRLEPLHIASIYPTHNEDRVLVQLQDTPSALIDGLIAVEDRGFHEHHGIQPSAVIRALGANLRAGRTVQGGSTLTQQLAKNFYLSSRRSLGRKINEALIALSMEFHYDKSQILEAYLNEIYLGQDGKRAIHGFGLASQFYFGRPLQELRAHETALLIALVKGPSYYNPRRHPQRALERRNLVLDIMGKHGVVDPRAVAKAKSRPLGVLAEGPSGASRYPAFVDLVRRQLRRDYREEDLRTEGLRIFTTLDPWAQSRAESVVGDQLKALEAGPAKGGLQAAAVMARPDNGEVLAVVGGRHARGEGFNRALDAVRPVGSLIKPAVYLAALRQPQRYTLATLIEDAPVNVRSGGEQWQPRNFDRQFHGEVLLYRALAQSLNAATVHLGLEVGLDEVRQVIRKLGVDRPLPQLPSLLLGAVELSPLEVAQMYQTLAAQGFNTPLRSILEVVTPASDSLRRYPLTLRQVLDVRSVYLVNDALQRAVREGTGAAMASSLPTVAGKTGTTNDARDSWFAGFSNDLVAVVWVGADDNRPIGLSGSRGAMRVWAALMRGLDAQPLQSVLPDGMEQATIDLGSGKRANENCEDSVQLPFVAGSAPTEMAPCARQSSQEGPLQWLKRIFR